MEDKILFNFITQIKNEYENNSNCNNYIDLELKEDLKNNEKYLFKPLEDINRKKETISRNGFIVYSKSKIVQKKWFKPEQKAKQKKVLKQLKDAGENFALRLYYYEKINNLGNEHITIIMINPAFAYSEDDDSTIRNIRNKLKIYHKTVKSFDILNISPIRNPYTDRLLELEKNLNNLYNKENYYLNLKYILSESNKVILAWGNTIDKIPSIKKIYEVLKNYKNLYILGKSKNNNPIHLLSINNKYLKWGSFKRVNINDNLKITTKMDA